MLSKFRSLYPTGRLISELTTIHNGQYIVRTLVQVNGENVGSGLASAETVELAEELARKRAIENLELDSPTSVPPSSSQSPTAVSSVAPRPSASNRPQPTSQKLTEVAATRDVDQQKTKTQTKTKTQVNEEPVSRTPEPASPIASTAPLAPVTIPPEPDNFDNEWLNGPSYTKSELEGQKLSGTSEKIEENQTPTTELTATSEPLDLSNATATIEVLLNNLNWSKEQERDYLEQTYGEKTRSFLDEEKLLDFQEYLEVLAKVTAKIKSLGWNPKQQKDYLKNHQGGRSLEELDAYELAEFLEYLEVFDKITQKIKELAWTNEQGKNYLQDNYGVAGRTRLSPEQLRDFLTRLESWPN
jgi:hypothetical protein